MQFTDAEGKVEVWSVTYNHMMFGLLKADFDLKFVSIDTTHQLEEVQANIVELIRGKFIIPDGKIYDYAMLKHNDNPRGIVRGTWLDLVEYWYLGQSKKYADNGREARVMLSHLHTNGSISFSNSRDEFEMEHGREPGGYEFFNRTH
ncbi:hypothetical protein RDABS01_025133 [Bienertia sinuspersici]